MQEMVELSKSQSSDTLPQTVKFFSKGEPVTLNAGPAHFGKQLTVNDEVSIRSRGAIHSMLQQTLT